MHGQLDTRAVQIRIDDDGGRRDALRTFVRQAHLYVAAVLFDHRDKGRVSLDRIFTACIVGLRPSFERDLFVDDENTIDGGAMLGCAADEKRRRASPGNAHVFLFSPLTPSALPPSPWWQRIR